MAAMELNRAGASPLTACQLGYRLAEGLLNQTHTLAPNEESPDATIRNHVAPLFLLCLGLRLYPSQVLVDFQLPGGNLVTGF